MLHHMTKKRCWISMYDSNFVQNVDSAFVLGAISDEDGSYYFSYPPEGDYRISVSKLGYETMWSPSFSFVKDETRVENLKLREVAVALDAITVSASRPLYQRSEEHTSELQSRENLVCRLLLDKK